MRVLTAIDLTVGGHDWLMSRAVGLAARLGATVDAVFVQPGARSVRELEVHRAALDTKLAAVPAPQRGVARVEAGDIVDALVNLANEYDALVVGPREPTGIARLLEGPVATRVLRRATCPVLVPRRPAFPDGKMKILLGIDVKGDIRHATTVLAGQWAQRLGGTIDLVYATMDRPVSARDALARKTAEDKWREAWEPTRKQVEALLMHAPEAVRGAGRIEPGEPDDVLVTLSADYDLVLVGNRDREGLSRFVLGTVASTVVRGSGCDVLTLPTASLPT